MRSINFSTERKPLTTFSLAGLADIVLLLLIFFLLTSSFIPQFGIRVNLPQIDASAPTDARYVTVAITSDGDYYVEQERTPREGLLDAVQRVMGDRTALVLRADQEATVGQFATVAGVAQALNLRVLMATERVDLRPH
jgi:biopolymer transport protein ExbD